MSDKLVTCDKCEAECCRFVTVEVDKPKNSEDWEDIRWQVAHKNVTVYLDNDNDWVIEFATDCEFLDDKWKCKMYEKRPLMCKNHDIESCVKNGAGNVHQVIFKKPEDVDEYLKNKNLKRKLGNKKKRSKT